MIDGERSWENGIIGEWWLLLHAAFILGRIPSKAAGILLVRLMRARYIRCQALDVMLDAGMRESAAVLDAAIDQVAAVVADETEDGMLREMAATSLLDFPRQRHRVLLESIAEGAARPGEGHGLAAVGAFVIEDVEDAYQDNRDKPGWLQRGDPWKFCAPEAITARQQRWQEEGTYTGPLGFDGAYALPYVRVAPKVGRNDPCPCGSGKKYKRCCLARDEATARDHLPFTP